MFDELFNKHQDLLNRLNCSDDQIQNWKSYLIQMSDLLKTDEQPPQLLVEYIELVFLKFENELEMKELKEKVRDLIYERMNCKDEQKKVEIEKQLRELDSKVKNAEKQKSEIEKNDLLIDKLNQQVKTLSEKDQMAFSKVCDKLVILLKDVNAGINKIPALQPEPKTEFSYAELQKLLEEQRQENERLKKENKILNDQLNVMQQSMAELKKQLEEQRKLLEDMKNNTLGTKVKNVGKKAKRKVVQVKKWAKANPKKTAAIIGTVALAGLVGSAVAYGHPLAFAGRVVSAMWKPLHNIGLGDPLHNINRFLFGKMRGATFDGGSGLWLLNGTPLNDLGAFETILNNVVGMGAGLAGGAAIGYGAYKVAKKARNAWLNRAEDGFINKMTNKIKSLGGNVKKFGGKIKSKLTNIFKNKKKAKDDFDVMSMEVDQELIEDCLEDIKDATVDDLIYFQKDMMSVGSYVQNNHTLPDDIDYPLTMGTIVEICSLLDAALQEKFDEYIENMSKEELENLAQELEEKFQNEANNNIDYFDSKYGIKLSVAVNKVNAKMQAQTMGGR